MKQGCSLTQGLGSQEVGMSRVSSEDAEQGQERVLHPGKSTLVPSSGSGKPPGIQWDCAKGAYAAQLDGV